MMYIQAPLEGNLLKILKNSASLSNGTATKEENAVNGERSLPNGNCQRSEFAKPLEARRKRKFSELDDFKGAVAGAEEEPEAEQFELLEVIDESDTKEVNEERRQSLPNGFEIEIDLSETSKNTATLRESERSATWKAVVSTEESEKESDSECYEFRLLRVPKRKLRNEQSADFGIFKSKKQCRPVPAAIPIAPIAKNSGHRLLNGISSRQLAAHESCDLYDISTYSNFESDIDYRALKDLAARDKQMGIDILGSIRQFFNWRAKNENTETTETQLGKRKRRSENLSTEDHFKYRRVENNFPKIITHSLDDDYSTPYRSPVLNTIRNPTEIPRLLQQNQSNFEMTQRGTEQNSRRSWFRPPQTTNKIVRNNYADIEFSDEDDEDTRRFQKSLGIHTTLENFNSRKQPRVINIPIQQEQPSLLSTTLKSALPSSSRGYNTTAINCDPTFKPTYAEALRYNIPFNYGIGHTLNGRSYSSNASSGSGTSTSRLGKGFGIATHLNSKNLGRSILLQDREIEEHAQYKKLLETINRAQYLSFNAPASRTASKKPRVTSGFDLPTSATRAPLSSTINIDDDVNDFDDVTITGVSRIKASKPTKRRETQVISTVILDDDDDDDISEIIDLDKEQPKKKPVEIIDLDAKENKNDDLPYVEPVNSFREKLSTIPHLSDNWLQSFNSKWEGRRQLRETEVNKTQEITNKLTAERRFAESELQERLRDFRIVDPELIIVDDFTKPEVEKESEFPELNAERQQRIKSAIYGPPDQVLVSKFNMNITRRDIQTLLGNNWLNDEVINFYMNLITERSELKHESHGYPTVYAMNTFFLQRLSLNGHSGVKRWTRKVNIFEKDILPIPVHVGGVHWCMAVIHLKNRWIRYYDSMGAPNPSVLKLLEQYLKDESLDKRKQPFDTSGFVIESVRDVPRQMNGSDCGVFSCMFAEYLTRNKEITFSQQHMEYFRHKMILEIVQGELLL